MKTGKKLIVGIVVIAAVIVGGIFAYGAKARSVQDAVKPGQTKVELAKAMFGLWHLKPQVVRKRFENMTDEEVRSRALSGGNAISALVPETLKTTLPVDGSVTVYSYVQKLRSNFPNGVIVTYLSVFYDTKTDKVLGSRVYEDYAEGLKTWDGVR
jgi:hypothetical protein